MKISREKITYDVFLEILGIHTMTEFKNGEHVFEVTKAPDTKIIADFQTAHKPKELMDEENKYTIDVEIKKEEIKDYVKDLKTMKSNL